MTTTETDAILALERRRCAAIGATDAAALREILTDDYLHVHANGRIDDLATYISAVVQRPRRCERGPITVRQYGAAAVLVGEQINTFETHKSVVVVQQVAVRQAGMWRFVSTQVTRKAEA